MKVSELFNTLSQLPGDLEVVIELDDSDVFGPVEIVEIGTYRASTWGQFFSRVNPITEGPDADGVRAVALRANDL